jgi:DNA repair protein RadC
MKIKDIPKDNRPRERFLRHGPEALSDAELFAIILRTGSKNENVIDMSNRLIAEYSLSNLFQCSLAELQKIRGIGPSKAMQLLAISELNKRISLAKNPIKKITCAKDVFDIYHARLRDEKQEHFIVLMLNTKNHIIGESTATKGLLDSSIIDPREVFKMPLKNSSSKIILIHNHPSGDPEPSQEDLEITQKLIDSGKLLSIQVLDHVIIAKDDYWAWKGK